MTVISYDHDGLALTGELTEPKGTPSAAILLLPSIAGAAPLMTERAQRLAALRYLVFILDFYGDGVAPDARGPAGRELMANAPLFRARVAAGLSKLNELSGLPGSKTAAIGHCMGGKGVLELARDGADLAAVVSFHGMVDSAQPAQPGAVKARLLVCHGHADPSATPAQITTFQEEMVAAGADWHLHVYSRAKHGFTDPDSDKRGVSALGYDASADRQSWAAMTSLFDEVFG